MAGVQPGDIILDVDNIPFSSKRFALHVEQTVTLGVERGGQRLELNAPLVPLAKAAPLFLISSVAPALVYWAASTLLLWRRFGQGEVQLLFVLAQTIAIAMLFPPPPFLPWCYRAFWASSLSAACFFLAPSLLLHFHITFPVTLGSSRQRHQFLGVLYGLTLPAAASWLAYTVLENTLLWQLSTLYAALELIIVIVILIYVYFYRATPDGRRRLRVLIPSITLAVGPFAFIYAQAASFRGLDTTLDWMVRLTLLIAPLGYTYAVLRHNLFGIDRVLNRALVYILLSVGILILYLGPFLLIHRLLPSNPRAQILVVAGLTMMIGLAFDWSRTRIQRLVDRLFYGGWYDYPGVVETISDALARSLDREQLTEVLTLQVPKLMQLHHGHLWIGGPDETLPHKAPEPSQSFSFTLKGQEHAIWTVGPRHDEEDFSSTDQRILETLAHQAEIALSNVLLVETLRRQLDEIRASRETLAQAQHQLLRSREEEQSRLARDLHDGPIQTLVGLNMQLSLLLAFLGDERIPADKALSTMRTAVRALLSELRQVCAELRPPMLDTLGLGAALHALAEEWSAQSNVPVALDLPPNAALRPLPGDVSVNLYRVVQEALSNVTRHAGARRVTICLSWDASHLSLSIQDDGRGFAVPDAFHDLTSQGHFGLVGMQERIDLIDGTWMIKSAPGQGTTVRVVWQTNTDL
ncbi:MAG: hypothetical protein GY832_13970 [Chloroflexi bacterium]|nr:hypothetical protein [Chloroflexota bacterium]